MDIKTFAAIFILATLVEALIEHLVKPFFWPSHELQAAAPDDDDPIIPLSETVRDIILRYVSAVLGVALCLAYKQDLLLCVGLEGIHPVIGQVITGIVIGRGANYLHDLISRWNPVIN